MTKYKKDFKMLTGTSPDLIAEKITTALNAGYTMSGNMIIKTISPNTMLYLQGMVRATSETTHAA